MAFEIPSKTLDFWKHDSERRQATDNPVQIFTTEDLAWIEETWGGRVPEDYRLFVTTYGAVSLNAPGVASWIMYVYRDDESETWEQGRVFEFLGTEGMKRHRAWMREDPDKPVFPSGYFPIAQNGLMSFFIMRVGMDASEVFFWEESDDPWGEGANTKLAFVAKNLADLFQNLKIG